MALHGDAASRVRSLSPVTAEGRMEVDAP